MLFPEGKQLAKRDQPLGGSAAKALLNKATLNVPALLTKGPAAIYDDLVARFGLSTELPARELVAAVLIQKGATLGLLGHNEEAIAVYDLLLARFGSDPEPSLRASVANALFNRGNVLRKIPGRAGKQSPYTTMCWRGSPPLARCRYASLSPVHLSEKGWRSVCSATMRKRSLSTTTC